MNAALLSLALMAGIVSPPAAAQPLKVFLFTNEVPSGAVDEQLKARRASLQDLVRVLSSPGYENLLTLVKNRDGADVIVELVSRGEATMSVTSRSTSSAGGATASASRSSAITKQFLKFRISADDHSDNLTTEDQLPWTKMAERAADDLVTWITRNVVPSQPPVIGDSHEEVDGRAEVVTRLVTMWAR
jgi:hypothetical protein